MQAEGKAGWANCSIWDIWSRMQHGQTYTVLDTLCGLCFLKETGRCDPRRQVVGSCVLLPQVGGTCLGCSVEDDSEAQPRLSGKDSVIRQHRLL